MLSHRQVIDEGSAYAKEHRIERQFHGIRLHRAVRVPTNLIPSSIGGQVLGRSRSFCGDAAVVWSRTR